MEDFFTVRQCAETFAISIWTNQLLISHHASRSVIHLFNQRQNNNLISPKNFKSCNIQSRAVLIIQEPSVILQTGLNILRLRAYINMKWSLILISIINALYRRKYSQVQQKLSTHWYSLILPHASVELPLIFKHSTQKTHKCVKQNENRAFHC